MVIRKAECSRRSLMVSAMTGLARLPEVLQQEVAEDFAVAPGLWTGVSTNVLAWKIHDF